MKYKVEFITHKGKVRNHNEDSLLIGDEIISYTTLEGAISKTFQQDRVCFAVADGMGGHNKGEVASKFVLMRLKTYLNLINSSEDLINYLQAIKRDLDEFVTKNSEFKNMGTVIAGIFFLKDKYIVFNIGDSRVYENSFGFANLLTTDHSLVYKLYKMGSIEFKDINTHPKKHIVTSALIANRRQELNEIFVKEYRLEGGEEFLICSDGVWENLKEEYIEECFSKEKKAECIFKRVMRTSANDNLSIIIVKADNE